MPGEDIKQAFYNKAKYTTNVVPADMYFDGFMEKVKSDPAFLKNVYSAMEGAMADGRIKKLAPYDRVASVFGTPPAPTEPTATPQQTTFPTPDNVLYTDSGTKGTYINQPDGTYKRFDTPTTGGTPVPSSNQPQVTPTGLPTMESLEQGGQPMGGQPKTGEYLSDLDIITGTPQPRLASGQYQATGVNPTQMGVPQTQQAQPTAMPQTSLQGQQVNPEVQEETAFSKATRRAVNQARLAEIVTLSGTKSYDEIKQIADIEKDNAKIPLSEAMADYDKDPTIWNGAKLAPEVAYQSLLSMSLSGWKTVLASMGAGAAVGGATGALPGAVVGAGYGLTAGMTAAGLAVETSSSILESLKQQGIDTTDPDALYKAFNDTDVIGTAKEYAVKRGIPILVFDSVTMGLAGKLLKIPAKTMAGKLAKAGGEVGLQMAGGGAGEAGAQLLSGQELNKKDILIEMLGEVGSTPVDIFTAGLRNGTAKPTDLNRVAVDPSVTQQDFNEAVDFQAGAGEISVQEADNAKAEFEKKKAIDAKIPAEVKDTELRVTAIGLIEERENLNTQLESVDEAFKPAVKEKINAINEQLAGMAKPEEETTTATETATEAVTPEPTTTEDIQNRKRKDLFPDESEFANVVGGSGRNSSISSYREVNGIGISEYTNPENGLVDVIMTGTSDNDYVGYVRIYENGKPTNRWTSKMENKSGNKGNFKTMITEVQKLLPQDHEYTEKTNISLDGLRVYANNLTRGYEVLTDSKGNSITNNVPLNNATLEALQGSKTEQEVESLYDQATGLTRDEFNRIKQKANSLIPGIQLLFNETNGSVIIKLPVLKKSPTTEAVTTTTETEVVPEGGETDKTGLVLYHGSPHSFENFDISKLGSGEGAQAFGHGLYFTNEVDIAKGYANRLGSKKNFWEALKDGNEISLTKEDFDFIKDEIESLGFDGYNAEQSDIGDIKVDGKNEFAPDVLEALAVAFGKNAKSELESFDLTKEQIDKLLEIKRKISDPQLYKIAIHEGKSPSEYDYIDWREILTENQRKKIGGEFGDNVTGEEVYKSLSQELGSDQKASEFLLSKGIDGISYKSAKGTGGKTGEGRNYVIFDTDAIRIDEINQQKQSSPQAQAEVTAENPALADEESTAKALEGKENKTILGKLGSFSIDNLFSFFHASPQKRKGRLRISNAPQFGEAVYFSTSKDIVTNEFGDNVTDVALTVKNPLFTGTEDWYAVRKKAIELADEDYAKRKQKKTDEENDYFRYDKNDPSQIDEIPSEFISEAAKQMGYDAIINKGYDQYENEIAVLDESKIVYEEDLPGFISSAYHSAKVKPESERTAQETELITQVEQLLTPTKTPTTPPTPTAETVATTTETGGQITAETTATETTTLTPVNATDVETITKIENATEKGRELALNKPTNKGLKRAFEAFEDLSARARKAGIYDGKTLKIGGQEVTLDTPAKFKAFLSNQGNFDAITEAVKGAETTNPVEAKKEFKEKNQKAREEAKVKAEQAQKAFDETMSGLEDTKTEAKENIEKLSESNKGNNDITLQSGVDVKQILKVPEAAMKVMNFGDNLIAKITVPIQEYAAKQVRKAMRLKLRAASQAANISQGFLKNLASTEKGIDQRRRFVGGVKSAAVLALEFYEKAVDIVGGNPDSLSRVHQVLDPELYEGKVTTGDIPRVNESDLTPDEKILLDLLRKNLDFIHEWHYANGFISKETYEKNKGNYSPRFWEMETQEDPELSVMYQQMGKSVNKKYIKQRQELDEMMKDADDAIQDPVFGTAMRMAQTLRNKAVVDYANQVLQTDAVHKGSEPPPPGYILLEGTKYGPLNGKYVARDIAEDFKGYFLTNEIANQAYRLGRLIDAMPATQFLKKAKTVYEAGVFIGNIIGNLTFGFKSGIDPFNLIANVDEANKDIDNRGVDYKHLLKEGVLGTDIMTEELRKKSESVRMFGKTISTGQTTNTNPLTGKDQGVIANTMESVEKWYGKVDDIAKVAAYKALRKQGMGVDEATRRVFEGFQNNNMVGRYYDVAAKTPAIGNRYVKFKGDSVRRNKNNWTKRPLTSIAYFSLLSASFSILNKLSGEDEDETKAREAMAYKPKVDFAEPLNKLGVPDISLTFQSPMGEINVARMLGTDYLYDAGEREFGGDLEEWSQNLPFQIKYAEDKDSPIPIGPAFNDVLFGPVAQLANNKDFRNKRILDHSATIYTPGRESTLDMAVNATKFLANAYIPYYGKGESMYSSIVGKPDQYDRIRTPLQSIVNNFIKVQEVRKPEILNAYKKDIDFIITGMENLDKDFSAIRNKAVKDLDKVIANEKNSQEYKDKKAEETYDQVMKKYAETEDRKAKMYERALKKFELIEPLIE